PEPGIEKRGSPARPDRLKKLKYAVGCSSVFKKDGVRVIGKCGRSFRMDQKLFDCRGKLRRILNLDGCVLFDEEARHIPKVLHMGPEYDRGAMIKVRRGWVSHNWAKASRTNSSSPGIVLAAIQTGCQVERNFSSLASSGLPTATASYLRFPKTVTFCGSAPMASILCRSVSDCIPMIV